MVEFKAKVEFEVYCTCGTKLDASVQYDVMREGHVQVEPCPDCMATEHDSGKDDGYDEGKDAGYKVGWDEAKLDSEPEKIAAREQTRKLEIDD